MSEGFKGILPDIAPAPGIDWNQGNEIPRIYETIDVGMPESGELRYRDASPEGIESELEDRENILDLEARIRRIRHLKNELIRRRVREDGDLGFFSENILGYRVRSIHRRMIEFQDKIRPGRSGLLLAPRGFGKSTILTIARAILEIIRDPDIRILIASNTQSMSEVFLREIKNQFTQNDLLIDLFGDYKGPDKWDTKEIIVSKRRSRAKESTITCLGVGGPVIARHYDLIIEDDVCDEENSRTEMQRSRLRTWHYKTLEPVLEPDGRHYEQGTRWHPMDLYGYQIKRELKYRHLIIPALEKNGKPDMEGRSNWEEKFSTEWLRAKCRKIGTAIFMSQYQNDVERLKGRIILEQWIRRYNPGSVDWSDFDFFLGGDPAATKEQVIARGDEGNSDHWTIVIIARKRDDENPEDPPDLSSIELDSSDGYGREIYVRDFWRGRVTKDDYLKKLREFDLKYHPVRSGLETTAAQVFIAQDAEKFMPITQVERHKDKIARAYRIQPFFENGQVYFPEEDSFHDPELLLAFLEELVLFPDAEHDDLFDGLETAIEVGVLRSWGSVGVEAGESSISSPVSELGDPFSRYDEFSEDLEEEALYI